MPALGLLIGVVGWNLPRVLAAQRRRRATSALVDESLLATELCAVSVHTGATVPQAIDVVAPYLFGPLGVCLTRVSIEHADGMLLDDGLASVTDELGEVVAPLVTILRAAHVDGDPVEPALSRLADRMRDDHRRLVETAVRQLSVRLLIPLVCCSLPGFVLIAVVPLVLGPLGTAGT
ncbi:MAG TPA: type II secretion system F family protein [Acidimicrobiales bacterium]|nr:type II secretion system F family protein [Acidimicrobiales bacterium]